MKSIELFAGAGGLAFGTAEAGFEHKIVVEWDSNACDTLRRNNKAGVRHVRDWEIIEDDVTRCDFASYGDDVDFVCGGPPCQPFSLGGKHRGHQDNRNMFPQAVRAVREVRPKAFLFENVRGLLRKNFANYYSYIVHQLQYPTVAPIGDEEWTHHLARLERLHTSGDRVDLRYNVVYQVVNAVDYGVPQHRWRCSSSGSGRTYRPSSASPSRPTRKTPSCVISGSPGNTGSGIASRSSRSRP